MRALATGEPQRDVVIGISTPDRGRSWISVTSEPLIDPARGATPYAVVSTFIDITERRRAQAALTHSERRHRMLVTNLPDAIVCLYDPQLRCVLAEGPMLAAQGYAPSDLIGRRMEDLVPPETVELLRPVFADALRGERRTIEYTSALSGLVYDMATIPFRDEDGEDGEIEGVFLIMRDVTERRTQEVAVRRAEADLRTYFEAATIGQAVIDGTGGILEANPALSVLFGLDRARLLGVELASLVHPADVALAQESLAGLRAGTTSEVQLQLRCMHAGGHPVHASAYAITLAPSCDGAHRFLVQIVDVTDRKRFEDQLQHLADHDPLTGLVNRRRFDQELARHVDLVRRYGADGAVILLDVDRFKQVNDTLGHNAGDRVITSVAHLLRDRLRTTDVLARLGGDEFAILLPKADRAGAEAVARSLVEAVRARMADIDGTGHGVTISLGAVVVEQAGGLTGERLLIDADLAMYAAKAAGRDGFAFRQGASSTDTHSVAGRV
jgi:diguanylate cyclase (GGDEF)-like protein/PAS domain S-box-containing protein